MKIAFVVTAFPTISETFILNQITDLIDCGHSVDIYARIAGSEDVVHEKVNRYGLDRRTFYFPQIPKKKLHRIFWICLIILKLSIYSLGKMFRAVNVFRDGYRKLPFRLYWSWSLNSARSYDMIHCHFAPNGVDAIWWRKLGFFSGKIITSFHGYDVNCLAGSYNIPDYNLLFKEGDAFTANSKYTFNSAEKLGCPADKIRLLPLGIKVNEINFQERQPNSDGEVRILTVSRLVECKGVEYSIRAIATLIKKGLPLKYTIVGDGKLRPSLEQLATKLGIAGHVHFLGWKTIEEIKQLYNMAQIFVHPSVTATSGQQEAQGLVLQEAQSSGLPIMTTDTGGISEGVVSGKSAFLIPEKDSDALAQRIEYLLEHPEIWPKMGRAGRAYVEKNYNSEIQNKRLVEIYQDLLSFKSVSNTEQEDLRLPEKRIS